MSGILNAIEISSQGLSVQRTKMNVVAENLANAETVETPEGGPYKRKRVVVSEARTGDAFQTELRRADTKLARTNSMHRVGIRPTVDRKSDLRTVESKEVTEKGDNFRLVYDPSHPMADKDGYVKMPDVNVIDEMVDMMAASRGYEANTVAISAAKKMASDALDI